MVVISWLKYQKHLSSFKQTQNKSVNMKFVIVFAAVFAVALAAPQNPDATAHVVNQQADISPDHGQYSFSHQTSNGIAASEQGTLNQPRSADATAAYTVQGQFSYTGPDGQQYTLRYTADENGFHPEAAHLPVAPQA